MLLILASTLLFAAVSVATYALLSATAGDRSPATARLRELRQLHRSTAGVSYREPPPLLRRLLATLGGFLPGQSTDSLRDGLVRAGIRRPDGLALFMGSKVLLAVALPLAWAGLAWTLGRPAGMTALQSAGLVAVGFYLPTFWLSWRKRERQTEIRQALADALDMMVVCVEAGLGLGAAIQRVGVEIGVASPALAQELAMINQEMLTGISRAEALQRLAERTEIEDVYNLVAMLTHADRLGTSIGQSMRAHAQTMRTRRRQRAEQLARKAAIKMLFPLVFLILPALLVVILGPAATQLAKALSAHP